MSERGRDVTGPDLGVAGQLLARGVLDRRRYKLSP